MRTYVEIAVEIFHNYGLLELLPNRNFAVDHQHIVYRSPREPLQVFVHAALANLNCQDHAQIRPYHATLPCLRTPAVNLDPDPALPFSYPSVISK